MGFTYPLISLLLTSLKDFQDRKLATNVIEKINEYGEDFIPQKFDVYQPLKRKYNPNDIDEVVEVWLNDKINQQTSKDDYSGGLLLMESKLESKVSYQVSWQKDNYANFNIFALSMNIDYLINLDIFEKFIKLSHELINLIEPVQGEIVNESLIGWNEPYELEIRHPELQWVNFFGKPYIDLFGREKLLSSPAYKVESIGTNVIALQTIESIFEPIPNDVRESIKKHLCENAFVWDGKRALIYKNKENIAPKFDFSNIMFDKTKPIIEPQIITRKKKQ